MTMPTPILRMTLGNSPLEATPSYRNLTLSSGDSMLVSGTITRKLGTAGTASFVLDNTDGWLNPWNTASPFYGNLLDAETADLVTTTGTWNPLSLVTLTRSTTQAFNGPASLRMESTGTGDMVAISATGTSGAGVVGTRTYTASALFRGDSLANFCRIGVSWYTAAGAAISSTESGDVTDSTSGWTLVAWTATAPSNAAYAAVTLKVRQTTATERHYVDTISFQGGNGNTLWYAGGQGGLMQPMVKTEFLATWSGTTYPVYSGFVSTWGGEWETIDFGNTTVQCIDGSKILTLVKPAATSPYSAAVLADTPRTYWRLSENDRSTASGGLIVASDSSGNARDGTYKGSVGLDANGALPADTDRAASFQRGSSGGWVDVPISTMSAGTGDFTIEAWVYPKSFDANGLDRIFRLWNVGSQQIQVVLRSDGTVRGFFSDGANGGTLDSTTALTLNRWNHVAVVKAGTSGPGNWHIYINGTDVSTGASTTGTGNVSVTTNSGQIGGFGDSPTLGVGQGGFDGYIDEVAVYASALNSTRVGVHYNANSGFNTNSLAGARIGALLDLVGWPAFARALDTGQFQMLPVTEPLFDTPPLAYILAGDGSLVESEGWPAAFFIDGAGNAVFQDRAHTAPSSAAVFSDVSSTLNYEPGPQPQRDDDTLWTRVVLQAEGGRPQIASDATAESRYVGRTLTRTGLRNADDADVATMAASELARHKTPHDKITRLVLHPPTEDPAMWPVVLGLDLNDVVTVARIDLPGTSKPFAADFRVLGITHQFDAQDWVTTLELDALV